MNNSKYLLIVLTVIGLSAYVIYKYNAHQNNLALNFQETQTQAEKGDAEAQFQLANLYIRGKGVKKNEAKAVEWLQKSAQQGYAHAQCGLAVCYLEGIGTSNDQEKDPKKAIPLLEKLTEQNYPPAELILGNCYKEGIGVAQDNNKAVELISIASRQKFEDAIDMLEQLANNKDFEAQSEAQFQMALLYIEGQGVDKDESKAVEWLQKSAKQNHPAAQFLLGQCYLEGKGINQDKNEALQWFRNSVKNGLSEESGLSEAQKFIEQLEKEK